MYKKSLLKYILPALFLLTFFTEELFAQHDHHKQETKPPAKPAPKPAKRPGKKPENKDTLTIKHTPVSDTLKKEQHGEHKEHILKDTLQRHNEHAVPGPIDTSHAAHQPSSMSHAYSLNLPMNRNGSGTGWLPDSSPMFGYMKHGKKSMLMFHGNIFLRYNNQDIFENGKRGDEKFDAPNWFMAMWQRKINEKGLLHFSGMLSLDPLTMGGEGYPLLFQSGETWEGKPLVDRQHPHNFFSELSISYAHSFNKDADAFVYLGYPGEPALGPVAFMHRVSSLPNPNAPLGHHWQDATHIVFGVATLGLRYKIYKLEGSSFTGREPGEDRFAFEEPLMDSWSARFSANPNKNLALQVSHGFIKSPEAIREDEDVKRTTASVIHSRKMSNTSFNNALVWGYNFVNTHHKEHSVLYEAALLLKRFDLYTRFEWIQKSAGELNIHLEHDNENGEHHDEIFNISAVTAGINYNVFEIKKTVFSIGTNLTLNFPDEKIQNTYGKMPVSGQVYLRMFPGRMN